MIYDLNGTVINSTSIVEAPGSTKTFSVLIDCKAGYSIRGSVADPDATLNGRANVGDAWADLTTVPIDTTAYAPARREFFFEIVVASLADPETSIVDITVSP